MRGVVSQAIEKAFVVTTITGNTRKYMWNGVHGNSVITSGSSSVNGNDFLVSYVIDNFNHIFPLFTSALNQNNIDETIAGSGISAAQVKQEIEPKELTIESPLEDLLEFAEEKEILYFDFRDSQVFYLEKGTPEKKGLKVTDKSKWRSEFLGKLQSIPQSKEKFIKRVSEKLK